MPASVEPLEGTVYLAPPGFEAELASELGASASRVTSDGALLHTPGPVRSVAWAANVWLQPVRVRFASVDEGAAAVRALGGRDLRWALAPGVRHPQAALLAAKLPVAESKRLAFPEPAPKRRPGSWCVVDEGVVVASARCTSPFPNGEPRFVEDHVRPPSRAYLKLWEALTVAGCVPRPGDRCVDLGSSPGGWTWALERLGARVISVDKAPIDERLTRLTRVRYVQDSAFAVDPAGVGRVNWLVSDVICYPARSVALIERWIAAHPGAGFVVTIKFQGDTDMASLRALEGIEGGRLVHLHHNKHELTWIRTPPAEVT
ncbi:MAG: SAM-dependent methyltransferase [Polyangiales bacterium]